MVLATASALAESVDIGLGTMDRSEFNALKSMVSGDDVPSISTTAPMPPETIVAEFNALVAVVQGRQTGSQPAAATPIARTELYGMVEMALEEFNALRDQVADHSPAANSAPPSPPKQMVDIGTGMMDANEFNILKKMVKKADILSCRHLIARQR